MDNTSNTPDKNVNDTANNEYILSRNKDSQSQTFNNEAANLIREKLNRIYAEEPDPMQEASESEAVPLRSKHQQFMHDLTHSGKDLATIQTEWHNYYINLPDIERRQVWEEFYASNITKPAIVASTSTPSTPATVNDNQALAEHKHGVTTKRKRPPTPKIRDARSAKEVQTAIKNAVTAGGTLKAKHQIQSLAFGLGMGFLVVFIFLFGFFNQVIIAPFIQPSRNITATPVILGSSTISPTATPEVIIPKINVEIPVNYKQMTTSEVAIENDLEHGVVHYPTTVDPGQIGNAAYFGHSSNNILNPGKYKFAFVLLHTIVPGDTFYLTYQGKVYIYKVIIRKIVSPSDVSVLNSVPGQIATATLITCDPPGTSLNRLVVVGKQISPNPANNTAPPAPSVNAPTVGKTLPGNGPSLWSRVMSTTTGKITAGIIILALISLIIRWLNKPSKRYKP